jgi:pyruvate kinase
LYAGVSDYIYLFLIVFYFRPKTDEVAEIIKIFDAGMSMARLNLSHGTLKTNLRLIKKFKEAKRLRPHKQCGLMLEVRGREIRISHTNEKNGTMRIRSGSIVQLSCGNPNNLPSEPNHFRINCADIIRYLKPNDVVYFDDGKVVGIIIDIQAEGCRMEIKIGGTINQKSQCRFTSGKHSHLPLVTTEDITDIATISQHTMIDFLAIPFASASQDMDQIRELLGSTGADVKILAKVDSMHGIEKFKEI